MNTIGIECCWQHVNTDRAEKCDAGGKRARVCELILVGPAVEEARHIAECERA